MIFEGNGLSLTVPGKNIQVEVSQTFDRKDLSGDGSGSDFATGGNKPKKIAVGLVLPMEHRDKLADLFALAEAVDEFGDPVPYIITDDLCRALNIRKVVFVDTIKVNEADSLRAWNVSFALRDADNTAAKREDRAELLLVEQQPPNDGEVAIPSLNPAEIIEATHK